jgi:hypothetical protein
MWMAFFTKGIDREKARALAAIGGKADLAAPIFWRRLP